MATIENRVDTLEKRVDTQEKTIKEAKEQVDINKLILFGDPKNKEDEGLLGFYNDTQKQNAKIDAKLDRVFTAVISIFVSLITAGLLVYFGLK